jgi:hypothetical protein
MTKTPTCVYLSLHLSIHGIFAMIVGTQPPLSNFFQVVQTKSTAARFYTTSSKAFLYSFVFKRKISYYINPNVLCGLSREPHLHLKVYNTSLWIYIGQDRI